MPGWLLRLLISAGIILLAYSSYALLKRRSLRAAVRQSGLPFRLERGKKSLIYFSTPDCSVCRGAQKPALDKLRDVMGDGLEIIEVNAYDQVDIAREWGVLSVPATVLLDEDGTPLAVNYGLASFSKLQKQFGSH
jgi:thiol-disulfide isomerase/thioredoxin